MTPRILEGKVFHKRLFPAVNAFGYSVYYLALPLSQINNNLPLTYNKAGLYAFFDRDHGFDDNRSCLEWAQNLLVQCDISEADGEIILIAFPRIFGYVFNPVSFWLCFDKDKNIRAVIYEVRNTFGEKHVYVCVHPDRRIISKDDILTAQKVFHVSPFLEREGHYEFRIHHTDDNFGVWIDYYDAAGDKKLITSLAGHFTPLTKDRLSACFWRYPLVTLKAIALIHWQAIKIILRKIRYIDKPKQLDMRVSAPPKKNMDISQQ